jgi:hypothetical protein
VVAAVVSGLSLDYAALVHALGAPVDPAALGAALLEALAHRYEAQHAACALHEFRQAFGHYLFDLASSAGLPQEDRTVAAWAVTPPLVHRRDTSYQRGFPLTAAAEGAAVDRGHLIPHLSGGELGPNVFRQDRALNRGWSEQGKRYRAMEREAAARPGAFYVGHLLYDDDTAYPSRIEVGVLRGDALHVEQFDNRPGGRA